MKNITDDLIQKYKEYLCTEEKSEATIEKYIRDVMAFKKWLAKEELNKQKALDYKNYLIQNYAPASVNSVISSLNSFFEFCNWYEIRIKTIKIQKQIFAKAERELTKAEYTRLLIAAQSKKTKPSASAFANNLFYGDKDFRAEVHNGRSVKKRDGGNPMQGKAKICFPAKKLMQSFDKICKATKNKKRKYFCKSKRKSS